MPKEHIQTDMAILGAGLTGLTLAYLLRNHDKKVLVIEARNRVGGRILTKGVEQNKPLEMGATWLGSQHIKLLDLLSELNLNTFDQVIGTSAIYEAISTSPPYLAKLPPNPEPSMRVRGGTEKIIQALENFIPYNNIILSQKATSISETQSGVVVETTDYTISAESIISTLPPNLLVSTIQCTPSLPNDLIKLSKSTHTWMGESIKISLTYAEPFWRNKNLSGTIMSNVGPIGEMYDHSNYEDSFYALKGFFNGNYYSVSKEERLSKIMKQLNKYYGSQAENYLAYNEVVWRNEAFTYTPYTSHVLPHQNNGHSMYQQSCLNGKLIIGGTETSSSYPGYMEGAVYSALNIASNIIST